MLMRKLFDLVQRWTGAGIPRAVRPCRAAVALLLIGCASPPAAPVMAAVRIELDASQRKPPISRNLFGKFTEHLGRNVYLGAWAQIVPNPEFAPARRWPNRERLERELKRAADIYGQADLLKDSRRGFAAYWSSRGEVHGRWIERPDGDSQELLAGAGGGAIEIGIFPPLHRTASYELTVKARAGSQSAIRVRILTTNQRPLGEVEVPLQKEWSERQYRLAIDASGHQRGEPYLLRLVLEAGQKVELDRLLLFPSDHIEGWDPEVVAYLKAARLPMLRFPGGNFASGYHWEDGIGALDKRPVVPNPAWPIMEWNHVGNDEWLRLCELVGATPLICVNAGNGTADEARRWVEYCNGPADTPMGKLRAENGHPAPYNVRYWEVGNELYGPWQIGFTDGRGYAKRYASFAKAMRQADPDILLIANGMHGPLSGRRDQGETPEWNRFLVQENGDAVRSVSIHSLPGRPISEDADPVEVWKEYVAIADGYGDYLRSSAGNVMAAAGLKPRVAVTEMQIFTASPRLPTNKTIAEALWLASILNTCIRNGDFVELLTHSALLNHGGGLRKDRGLVFTDPVWWTTDFYASQPGVIPTLARTTSPGFSSPGNYLFARENVPYVDAVALLNTGLDEWNIFVVNRDPENDYEATLELRSFEAAGTIEVQTLTAPDLLTRNDWERPDAIGPVRDAIAISSGVLKVNLPPLSLTRYTVRKP